MRIVFGLSALVAALACGRSPAPSQSGGRRPDLVLITIDTLRADRVGRGLTPALDALAARGLKFTNARATAPLTLPSHVSMMTGALPPAHGVRENGTHRFGGTPAPLARRLTEMGYRTAAFVGAYVLDRRFGLADGFGHYDDQISRDPGGRERLEAERPGNAVVDRALAWLEGIGARGSGLGARGSGVGESRSPNPESRVPSPFFLWVHLYDPHAPYNRSYDQDVAFADAQVGRLLHALGPDATIIAAGDHGESLGEHGERTHGMLAYDAALRAPLILVGPGIAPSRRADPVSLADIAETMAGLSRGERRGLLAPPAPEREIYAETEYPRVAGWSPVYALVQDRWKAILSRETELYDLTADPAETRNVAGERSALATAMASRIAELRRSTVSSPRQSVSPDVADRLRALGYVAGPATPPKPGDGPNPADAIARWGEFEEALAARDIDRLRALARTHPNAPVFQSTYARALADTGSPRSALDVYRRIVARWPNDAMLFHELAVAARDAGLAEEAMKAERAALTLDPELPAAHNGAGLLLADAQRHRDAADAFGKAVQGDPTNASYWVNLGNARRAADDAAGATDAYQQALALDPRSPDAANGLGVMLVQQKRGGDAIAWFERALQASPDFVEARLNLGIAYQETGQRDRAVHAYRDVLARARAGSAERRAAAALLRSLGQ